MKTVATFQVEPSDFPISEYLADLGFKPKIDWDDGSGDSDGTIVPVGGGDYEIVGSHTYEKRAIHYPVTVTTPVGDVYTTAQVDDQILKASPVQGISASEGGSFLGDVATFEDSDLGTTYPTDYKATIDWGDGSTSTGLISQSSAHTFIVEGATRSRRKVRCRSPSPWRT